MSSTQRFVLFYSEHCKFCSEIIKELDKGKLLAMIRLFSVDENRSEVPKCIKNVPTLYVSKTKFYIGGDIYKWIHDINNVYAPSTEARKYVTKHSNVPREVCSLDINPSFSNGYTFLTENNEKNEFIEHKFTFLNSKHDKIQTMQEDSSSSKCTEKDYEEYLKRRSIDMRRITQEK